MEKISIQLQFENEEDLACFTLCLHEATESLLEEALDDVIAKRDAKITALQSVNTVLTTIAKYNFNQILEKE